MEQYFFIKVKKSYIAPQLLHLHKLSFVIRGNLQVNLTKVFKILHGVIVIISFKI